MPTSRNAGAEAAIADTGAAAGRPAAGKALGRQPQRAPAVRGGLKVGTTPFEQRSNPR